MSISKRALVGVACLVLFGAALAWASISGSISGIVTDPSNAVVANVTVKAINAATNSEQSVQTDGAGFYNFPNLAVGDYDIVVEQTGFKSYRKSKIHIDANSSIRVDVKLELGAVAEKVTVASDVLQVETQSTQNGEVINAQKLEAVPLNGRNFTDLLALQPGVVPTLYAAQAPGLNDRTVGGSNDLNAGNQSINGNRETANGFMVNGANVNEGKNNGTAVIPNLDSIEEFRIITNNFDAEYGNYSGGQVNVVTKSGTDQFHGSLFEFNRNTAFNARNFFAPTAGKLIQNQFGGTIGGPIKRNRAFFFADYQGTKLIFGPTASTTVPSLDDRMGMLADVSSQLTKTVNSDVLTNPNSWANVLSNRLGYPVIPGEAYFTPTCNTTNAASATGCVFPGAVIPQKAWSPAAVGLLPFIPEPNGSFPGGINFSTTAAEQRLTDNKGGIRFDLDTHKWGMFSAYWHIDNASNNNPYPNSGATVPGFNAVSNTQGQVFVLSLTTTLSSTSVNEFSFSYLRSANHLFEPQGSLGTTLASLGFVTPFSTPGGIAPIEPALEGVPSIGFTNFNIGVPSDTTNQFNNTFQWQDNFTKVVGTHSIKFGGQFHYDQINDRNFFGENGDFTFSGAETGLDFADFLLGAPDSLIQASKQILDSRAKYLGLYAQDSWRVTHNLTLNYGLRWDVTTPWYDTQNKIETIIPGVQSRLFLAGNCAGCTGAPTSYLVPGDPGVPRTLAPVRWGNVAPRIGLAYSPSAETGFLAKLTGGPGKTSIRAAYGMFFSSIEDLTQFQEIGDPPYGLFYVSPVSPLLESPYIDRGTGNSEGQRFPFVFPSPNVSAKNPNTTFNWAGVEPISGALAYNTNNVTPRTQDYEFSLQRQFGSNTVMSLNYVGNQGHQLIAEIEANLPNLTLCEQLTAAGATPSCGPFAQGNLFTLPPGAPFPAGTPSNIQTTATCASGVGICNAVNTVYSFLGPQLGNNPYESTIAQSSYNSFQASVKHTSSLSSFLLGYTWSKCMDNASGLQEGLNPINPRASIGLCIFDVTQNFVGSYEIQLPFDRAFHATTGWRNKVAAGWSVTGITTFATGLPVTLSETDDGSCSGTVNTEANIDVPNLSPGQLFNATTNTNPRVGMPYFNVTQQGVPGSIFSLEMPCMIGNSRRRFFHGPGLNNWDMGLLKNTQITESKSIQFRFEAFNIFNHAQFQNPNGTIDSQVLSPTAPFVPIAGFGFVTAANPPRVLQAALKFLF
jgi:hypothetical protein